MLTFLSRLKQSALVKNFSYSLSANIISQLRGLIIILCTTKLLSVEEYGQLVLVTFLIATVIDISDLGVNTSTTRFVARYFQQHRYKKYLAVLFYSFKRKAIAFGLTAAILTFGAYPIALGIFNDLTLKPYVYISLLGIFFGMFWGLENSIYQGKQYFARLCQIAALTFVLVMALLGLFYLTDALDLGHFVLLNIAITCISFVLGTWYLRRDLRRSLLLRHFTSTIKKDFNAFGNWMLLWSLFVIFKTKIDILMLTHLASTEQIAYYDLANKFTKPVLLIFSSYGQVLTPVLAGLVSYTAIHAKIKHTVKPCLLLSLALVLLILLSPLLIRLIIGDNYAASVLPMQLIFGALIFYVWTMPFNSALFALNKPYVFSIDTATGVLVTVAGNAFLIPYFGAIGASLTLIIVNMTSLGISIYFYYKTIRTEKHRPLT